MTIMKFIKVITFCVKNFKKVTTFCVELIGSPNAKCYKILMISFLAKYRFGEADTVRKDVFCSNTSIISPDSLIF